MRKKKLRTIDDACVCVRNKKNVDYIVRRKCHLHELEVRDADRTLLASWRRVLRVARAAVVIGAAIVISVVVTPVGVLV